MGGGGCGVRASPVYLKPLGLHSGGLGILDLDDGEPARAEATQSGACADHLIIGCRYCSGELDTVGLPLS